MFIATSFIQVIMTLLLIARDTKTFVEGDADLNVLIIENKTGKMNTKDNDSFNMFDENFVNYDKGRQYELELTNLESRIERRQKRSTLSEDPCYENGFCINNSNPDEALCYCDELCPHFGDCCHDSNIKTQPHILNVPDFDLFRCVRKDRRHGPINGFWTVVDCPREYQNNFIKSKCKATKSLLEILAVFDNNGIMYQNAYCAICNNVTNYTTVAMIYNVDKCFASNRNITTTNCRPVFVPPANFTFRNCFHFSPPTNNTFNCQWYQNPIAYPPSNCYKNYFCHPAKDLEHLCLNLEDIQQVNTWYDMFPLTVLMWFTSPVILEDDASCHEMEPSDTDSATCINTKCEADVPSYAGACLVNQTFKNYRLQLDFTFESNSSLNTEYFERLVLLLFYSFGSKIYEIIPKSFFLDVEIGNTYSNDSHCAFGSTTIVVAVTNAFFPMQELDSIQTNLVNFSWTYFERNETQDEVTYVKINSKGNIDKDFCRINSRITYQAGNWLRPGMVKDYSKTYGDRIKTAIFENRENLCLDVVITGQIQQNNLNNYPFNYSGVFTFEIGTKTLLIQSWDCKESVDTTNKNLDVASEPFSVDSQTILTYTSMAISCIALAVSITIHTRLYLYKSIPGSNTMNLFVTMLLAHVLFLVGIGANDNQIICTILGIAIHYFWITSFAFMNIAVLHISVSFCKLPKAPNAFKSSSENVKRKLTILGYGLPLLILVPSIVSEFWDDVPFSVGYNGAICFPTEYPAVIIFVSGPLTLSISINMVGLVISVLSICKQTVNCKLLDKSYSAYLPVYARLSIISGIVWIFGIISALFPTPVMQTLFIVFVGLQGFFVSLSSTCTARVYRSLRTHSV